MRKKRGEKAAERGMEWERGMEVEVEVEPLARRSFFFFFLVDYSSGDDLSLGRTCADNSPVGVRPAAR